METYYPGALAQVLEALPYWRYYLLLVALSLIVAATWFAVRATVALVSWRRRSKLWIRQVSQELIAESSHIFLVAVAIAFVGFTVGALAGNSRDPVADSAITAAMAVFGAGAGFLYSRGDVTLRRTALCAIVPFCLAVTYGNHIGATNRSLNEQDERHYAEQLLLFKSKLKVATHRLNAQTDNEMRSGTR